MNFDVEEAREKTVRMRHFMRYGWPLNKTGRQAAMLAVLGVVSVEDAAAMAGVEPADLIKEAQAWAVASELENTEDL
jgi:hypothetical protein